MAGKLLGGILSLLKIRKEIFDFIVEKIQTSVYSSEMVLFEARNACDTIAAQSSSSGSDFSHARAIAALAEFTKVFDDFNKNNNV